MVPQVQEVQADLDSLENRRIPAILGFPLVRAGPVPPVDLESLSAPASLVAQASLVDLAVLEVLEGLEVLLFLLILVVPVYLLDLVNLALLRQGDRSILRGYPGADAAVY